MFALWVALLAMLLFLPVSRLIWIASVRRLQRKLGRQLETAELRGQKRRAQLISLPLVFGFSWLFNLATLGGGHG